MNTDTTQPAMTSDQLQSDLNTIRAALGASPANEGPHRVIIAAANTVCGLLLLTAIPFILLGTSIPLFVGKGESGTWIPLVAGIGVTLLLLALASPFLLAAWGLFKRRSWGGAAASVAAFFNLLNIPFGTAVSIYTFWALANDKLRTRVAP
jgi:hypothetical protein